MAINIFKDNITKNNIGNCISLFFNQKRAKSNLKNSYIIETDSFKIAALCAAWFEISVY